MTGAVWRSALVAALFGLHPLRVESVAWICERKDVLSAFFALLTLWCYARYVQERSKAESRGAKAGLAPAALDARLSTLNYYCLALFFFALGLMSKPMVVTLPFVLVAAGFLALGRVPGFKFEIPGSPSLATSRRLLIEKNSILHAGCDSLCHHLFPENTEGVITSLAELPFTSRMENALVSYGEYLHKIFGRQVWQILIRFRPTGRW